MPTKQGPADQHIVLHQQWPTDCCLCRAQGRIAELETELVRFKCRPEYLHGYDDGCDSRQGEIDNLLSRLREVEWSGEPDVEHIPSCPVCRWGKPRHAPDCGLKADLEKGNS